MNGFRAAVVVLALAGCAAQELAPVTVREAVAEAPCDPAKLPRRPVFPADALTGGEDIFTIGTVLWADRKARKAYGVELEVFAAGCAGRPSAGP